VVKALSEGESGVMIALRGRQMERAPLDKIDSRYRPLDSDLYEMA
jgi:hypothetical protein